MCGTMSDLKATKISDEEKLVSLMSNYRTLCDKTGFMTTLSGITSGRRLLD
jgi:hypothetical protein